MYYKVRELVIGYACAFVEQVCPPSDSPGICHFVRSNLVLEYPKDRRHGHFATPVSFLLAKKLRKNPKQLASDLADFMRSLQEARCAEFDSKLEGDQGHGIEACYKAGNHQVAPGFQDDLASPSSQVRLDSLDGSETGAMGQNARGMYGIPNEASSDFFSKDLEGATSARASHSNPAGKIDTRDKEDAYQNHAKQSSHDAESGLGLESTKPAVKPVFEELNALNGYLNLKLSLDFLQREMQAALRSPNDFAKQPQKNHRILLEYVSANPTGPLHIGHARGALFGSALQRIGMHLGYEIVGEYYVNDAGSQISMLALSVYNALASKLGLPPLEGEVYMGEYIDELAQLALSHFGRDYFSQGFENLKDSLGLYAKEKMLDEIRANLNAASIDFQSFVSERALYDQGLWEDTLEKLKSGGVLEDRAGALWLKSSLKGDSKDRVLVRDSGEPTYLAGDLTYHRNKFERGFDSYINLWGADHHGYVQRVKASLEFLGFDSSRLEVLLTQMVSLLRGGQPYKMSKRAGNFILMQEVIEDLGADSLKFIFLSKSLDTHLEFDLEDLNKQDLSNPVFYINYANARIHTLLKRSSLSEESILCASICALEAFDTLGCKPQSKDFWPAMRVRLVENLAGQADFSNLQALSMQDRISHLLSMYKDCYKQKASLIGLSNAASFIDGVFIDAGIQARLQSLASLLPTSSIEILMREEEALVRSINSALASICMKGELQGAKENKDSEDSKCLHLSSPFDLPLESKSPHGLEKGEGFTQIGFSKAGALPVMHAIDSQNARECDDSQNAKSKESKTSKPQAPGVSAVLQESSKRSGAIKLEQTLNIEQARGVAKPGNLQAMDSKSAMESNSLKTKESKRPKSIAGSGAKAAKTPPDTASPSEDPLKYDLTNLAFSALNLPRVLQQSYDERALHKLCEYLKNLAKEVHAFYNAHRILNTPFEGQILQVLSLASLSLSLGFSLLGIEIKTSM